MRRSTFYASRRRHELFKAHTLNRIDDLQFSVSVTTSKGHSGSKVVVDDVPTLHAQVASNSINFVGVMMLHRKRNMPEMAACALQLLLQMRKYGYVVGVLQEALIIGHIMTNKEQILYDLFGFNTNDIDYLINVSERYHYIYFETPKVGCSTIKKTLQVLEVDDPSTLPIDVHDKEKSPLKSPSDLKKCFSEYLEGGYYKFSFVRNPYTRILSSYLDKVLGPQRNIRLPSLGFALDDIITFEDFLLAVQKQSVSEMDVHWKPQYILLGSRNIKLDFIGKQETFIKDLNIVLSKIIGGSTNQLKIFNEIPHAVGANEKLNKYLTPQAIDLINDIYDEDFKNYNYQKQ